MHCFIYRNIYQPLAYFKKNWIILGISPPEHAQLTKNGESKRKKSVISYAMHVHYVKKRTFKTDYFQKSRFFALIRRFVFRPGADCGPLIRRSIKPSARIKNNFFIDHRYSPWYNIVADLKGSGVGRCGRRFPRCPPNCKERAVCRCKRRAFNPPGPVQGGRIGLSRRYSHCGRFTGAGRLAGDFQARKLLSADALGTAGVRRVPENRCFLYQTASPRFFSLETDHVPAALSRGHNLPPPPRQHRENFH